MPIPKVVIECSWPGARYVTYDEAGGFEWESLPGMNWNVFPMWTLRLSGGRFGWALTQVPPVITSNPGRCIVEVKRANS